MLLHFFPLATAAEVQAESDGGGARSLFAVADLPDAFHFALCCWLPYCGF